jgi:hypothetical protein
MATSQSISHVPTSYWHHLDDGRIQCDLCPRYCRLHEGQSGLCFVRARQQDQIVLTTYGRSSGFCVDPIEKKPLHHFLPGTPVMSFGTAGCNLSCKFCQNWDMSKSRDTATLAEEASPEAIACTAARLGCRSVAYSQGEIDQLTRWVVERLGPDVPIHFNGFHPDYRMLSRLATPTATLAMARTIAMRNGLRYAYTGNVDDAEGGSTFCHHCGRTLIGRNRYELKEWNLRADGVCRFCGTACARTLEAGPGRWGARRIPIRPMAS